MKVRNKNQKFRNKENLLEGHIGTDPMYNETIPPRAEVTVADADA
jgi:hypothetical protein